MDPKTEPPSEIINIGDNATIQGNVFTGGKRVVNTGGGTYIERNVTISRGDFFAGDKIIPEEPAY